MSFSLSSRGLLASRLHPVVLFAVTRLPWSVSSVWNGGPSASASHHARGPICRYPPVTPVAARVTGYEPITSRIPAILWCVRNEDPRSASFAISRPYWRVAESGAARNSASSSGVDKPSPDHTAADEERVRASDRQMEGRHRGHLSPPHDPRRLFSGRQRVRLLHPLGHD